MSRRWSVLSMLVLLAFVLAACGEQTGTSPTPATQPTQMVQQPTTVMATTTTEMTGTTEITDTTTPMTPTGQLRTPQEVALEVAGGKQIGGSVTVLGTWGGSEQDSFLAMVAPFEEATGVQVQYEGTRDLNAILTTRVEGGNPPDLAGLPGPGQMAEFAAQGKLIDLNDMLPATYQQQHAQNWIDLGTVDGKLVGVFIKAAAKGFIWYNPKVWSQNNLQPPQSWDDLMILSEQMANGGTPPWCIGMESGAASGWPGTDWLEDIVLRQAGPDVYDSWYQGKIAWTAPEIKAAWETWGTIVGNPEMVYGGANTMLTTAFGNAGDPLFSDPPGCYMHHQASFITDFFQDNNPNVKPVEDFNFFGFPSLGDSKEQSLEVAGDLFGVFKDTPQARALIQYLMTPEAQAIWVKRGGALSPNRGVPLDAYPDPLSRKAAELLTSADIVRFDASDLMPEAMNNAFWQAILNYVQAPDDLDSILRELDEVQLDAYK